MIGTSYSFPARGAGIGLLLLRVSLVAALFLGAHKKLPAPVSHPPLILPVALAVVLGLGFLTPIGSVVCAVFYGVRLLAMGAQDSAFILVSMFDAAALALIGPGAYSLDARLFGRRVIVFPPAEHSRNSESGLS